MLREDRSRTRIAWVFADASLRAALRLLTHALSPVSGDPWAMVSEQDGGCPSRQRGTGRLLLRSGRDPTDVWQTCVIEASGMSRAYDEELFRDKSPATFLIVAEITPTPHEMQTRRFCCNKAVGYDVRNKMND